MRIWDVHPAELCNKHLLGQHLELHCMVTIIGGKGKGYANHPEVKRFAEDPHGLMWLSTVHSLMVAEMEERWPGRHGLHHPSPLSIQPSRLIHVLSWPPADDYVKTLLSHGYPPTRLEHGTPWERDGVAKEWYTEHWQDWSHELVQQLYKEAEVLVAEPPSAHEGEVIIGGDGRPHVVHSVAG